MKLLIAAIASLGAMGTWVSSAMADVSINIRLGSSPSYRSHTSYSGYNSVPYYQERYEYHNWHNNGSVIVKEVYPSSPSYYGNSRYRINSPTVIYSNRSNNYDWQYNHDRGEQYIIEKRIIRVR
ncbi:hypothetical protein [Pseudanabaena sp. UWO310]|uniref:hypothetical protein n=1 Tax=Pseudanabaena sp. UWO310 TaxID=2480795 RepID=UPI001160F05B|nr:hypothetical protein [Pseudanabaena sp. UWO310]TYQ23868.1 hypothetical protein PseudUWO310_21645 [Pseudanabaena sp. UWO310]